MPRTLPTYTVTVDWLRKSDVTVLQARSALEALEAATKYTSHGLRYEGWDSAGKRERFTMITRTGILITCWVATRKRKNRYVSWDRRVPTDREP